MKKKKILFIITKSNLGGAQRYVLELATGLPKNRFEVVVAFGGSGLLKSRLEGAGIRTHEIASFERDINLVKELRSMRELYALMQEEQPDIVHLNSSKAGGSGALIARLCGVHNIIFTAHGWPFYEPRNLVSRTLIWFFSYLTTLLAHHVIVVSEHDRVGARMPGLTQKLTCIHTALPSLTFETQADARAALFPPDVVAAHAKDVWLVSTGEHTRNKNLGTLIEAIALLPDSVRAHTFLTLMGDGEQRAHLERLILLHNLSDHISITGFVPEARAFLHAFDVFVMPSRKEGFPYGLLEAGAAGLAVIASNVGGIPEIIDDGTTGLLIDPMDTKHVTTAITTLVHDAHLRSTFGKLLREKVTKQYALPSMIERTIDLYEANGSLTA